MDINKNITDFLKEAKEIQNDLDQSTKKTGYVGFVYLLRIDENIYKIGMSQNLSVRFGQLLLDKIEKGIKDFTVLFLIETNAPRQLEERLRQEFMPKRVKGQKDHFYLSTDDIKLIRVIAESETFKNEYPKPAKYLARPGSIEDFLNKILKRKHDLIAVAYTLAANKGRPLTIEEISESMTPIKYDDEDIAKAIKKLELGYDFIAEDDGRFELNQFFWDKFATREYLKTYRMYTLVEKEGGSSYGMGLILK